MNDALLAGGAFLAGLMGSTHCLAMCGGIAGALGAAGGTGLRSNLLYNLGRIGSYTLAGAVAGGLAFALGRVVDLAAWSVITRGLTGLILVLIGLNIALGLRLTGSLEALGGRAWARLSPLARRMLSRRSPAGMLGLGALWGWLPCGLTYSMLVAAMGAGNALDGAGLMLAFGLGTAPAMVAAGTASAGLRRLARSLSLRRASGLLLVLLGLWTAGQPLASWLGRDSADPGHHHVTTPGPAHSPSWMVSR